MAMAGGSSGLGGGSATSFGAKMRSSQVSCLPQYTPWHAQQRHLLEQRQTFGDGSGPRHVTQSEFVAHHMATMGRSPRMAQSARASSVGTARGFMGETYTLGGGQSGDLKGPHDYRFHRSMPHCSDASTYSPKFSHLATGSEPAGKRERDSWLKFNEPRLHESYGGWSAPFNLVKGRDNTLRGFAPERASRSLTASRRMHSGFP
eukprot:CAMPEP_0172710082 /NCGR_PEP_ID=MMETSP1074-20121228/55442_1 /TAXON_ID=2916 /ORGANISM="Ceratium fusus, Strain PA161109" /LENGTH=203 /DNA_ID=CAMNT_0013533421 /DNA_START=58 /DNA_END=669 /DNA_ORIENTATION=+